MTTKAADTAQAGVPHVLTAISAVMEEVSREGIAKDRNNQQQGYKFRGIDDVYNALAPLLSKHKLIIKPRGLGRVCEERQTAAGKPIFYVNVEMEFEAISAEDGSRETAGPFYGEAMDSADKATNKAQSAAYKYMAMQLFCIPTEGENDADSHTHEVRPRQEAAPRQEAQPRPDTGRKPGEPSASVTACIAQFSIIETEAELREWADKQKAFTQKLDEDEYAQVLAAWKARMDVIRAPKPADADPFAGDPVKAMEAAIDVCANRVELDRWAADNKAALDGLEDGAYKALLARWKARHAALAPNKAAA